MLNHIVRPTVTWMLRLSSCQVMQIFYPYSMQLHPTEFPGQDPRDCPRDADREK